MVRYYQGVASRIFHPDRRERQQPIAGANRREVDSLTVTSEQYEHLRDCLLRREVVREKLGASVRRVRHLLVAMSAGFLAMFFSASSTTIAITLGGTAVAIPLSSIAAVVPFVIAYMIVYACDQARTKMRLGHECQVLDAELQRFGGETSHSVLGRFAAVCRAKEGLWDELMAPRLNHAMYAIRDVFFVLTVVVALGWAIWLAASAYISKFGQEPHVVVLFFLYLLASVGASVASPITYRALERKKNSALNKFLAEQARELPGMAASKN